MSPSKTFAVIEKKRIKIHGGRGMGALREIIFFMDTQNGSN